MCRSKPIARKAELTVRRPGARIAPIKSTWAFCQTRLENSGANGATNRIIVVGRVRNKITSFWQIAVTSVPYPFRPQMAKVELERLFEK